MCNVYFAVYRCDQSYTSELDLGQNVESIHGKDVHFLTQVRKMSKSEVASTLEEY